jgi:hypothetical protein
LRGKAFGRKTPLGSKDGLLVPVADFRLRAGIADAVNGREQEIVSRSGSGTRSRPQRFQQRPHTGLFCSQPQGAGETEISQGGGEGDGGGLLLDEFGEFFGGAQIGLMIRNLLNGVRAIGSNLAMDRRSYSSRIIICDVYVRQVQIGNPGHMGLIFS